MKIKYLLLVLFCFVSKISLSQDKPEIINAADLFKKGLDFYDAQDYENALKEFQKIPENDTAYFSAVVEQVLTYYQLKKYEEGIAIGKKALTLKLYLSPELYIDMGSCYDNLEKYDEAIKLYDEALKLFPKNNFLYYNKGYSLSKLEKSKEAFECYKKSAELNPFHARTHFALGALAMNEGKTALAMLAFSTSILLDPSADISNNALVCINEMASTKYMESTKPTGIDVTDGDDFSDIDMLIQNYVALDKKYKVKSSLQLPFVKQDYLIFDKLPDNSDNKGFWSKLYIPFYKRLLKENKFDLFANYLLIASANESHKKIVQKNKSRLISFTDWIRDTWDNQHRKCKIEFNGKMQDVDVFRSNRRYAISSIGILNDAQTAYVGYAELYHNNGKLKAYGKYNSDGKKDGEWIWYYENGNIKSTETYNNGELTNTDWYSFLGIIETHIPYQNGKLNGEAIAYTGEGAKSKFITFKDEEREGNYEEYYSNGQVSLKGINKKGIYEGAVKTYYDSGELKGDLNYEEGKKNALETYYYRNGKIMQKESFVKGKLQGEFISYFENGKIQDSLRYFNDNPVGKSIEYHKNGVISELSVFDENGKLNGVRKQYDSDGKMYCELDYKKGEIIGYKYFNKKGDIIKQDLKKSGNFDFEGYYYNGIIQSKGKYDKENKQGNWTFYDENGNISSTSNYVDGKTQGEDKVFFPNGNVKKTTQYKDDKAEGYYIENYKNGTIYMQGNYKDDNLEGDWITYNPDKSLSAKKYFIEGSYNGIQKYFTINGQLSEAKNYYKDILLNSVNYDTLGNAVDSINFINASGKIIYHFYKGGPVKCELNMLYNNFTDLCYYFPNGKIHIKGKYFDGEKNGPWVWYHLNGNIDTKGAYEYGDATGKWEYYNEDGKLYRTIDYENGKINGKDIYYYDDGKIESERALSDGIYEGTSYYYSPDGQLEHKRQYLHDQLISYTYFEPNGTEKTIEVTNETADIKIYFKKGKLARQFSINKGLYQGEYDRYYSSGQLYEKCSYSDNDNSGENIFYYPNGKIKEKKNYLDGKLNGVAEEYYSDGKLKETSNYLFDKEHGKCRKYDKNGKLIMVLTYYDGDLYAISDK